MKKKTGTIYTDIQLSDILAAKGRIPKDARASASHRLLVLSDTVNRLQSQLNASENRNVLLQAEVKRIAAVADHTQLKVDDAMNALGRRLPAEARPRMAGSPHRLGLMGIVDA